MAVVRKVFVDESVDDTYARVGNVFSADSQYVQIVTVSVSNTGSGNADFRLRGRVTDHVTGNSGPWVTIEEWNGVTTSDGGRGFVGDPEFDEFDIQSRVGSGTSTVTVAFRYKEDRDD